MKKIKHISSAPDAVGTLVTLFFEDGTKLSVTVKIPAGQRLSGDMILAAVEQSLGLDNGLLAGSKIDNFVKAIEDLGQNGPYNKGTTYTQIRL